MSKSEFQLARPTHHVQKVIFTRGVGWTGGRTSPLGGSTRVLGAIKKQEVYAHNIASIAILFCHGLTVARESFFFRAGSHDNNSSGL